METIITTTQTQPTGICPSPVSRVAMSAEAPVVVRERQIAIDATATKGHLGFVAYVPGPLAWSPPLC